MELVSKRIHGLPEATMKVGGKLPRGREPLERFLFPDRAVPLDKVHRCRLQNKKSAIDPGAVSRGLFVEVGHELPIEGEGSKSARCLRGRHRRQLSVPRMIIEEL